MSSTLSKAIVLGLGAVALACAFAALDTMVVHRDSMENTLHSNDLIIVINVASGPLRFLRQKLLKHGQIVTFQDKYDRRNTLVKRIIAVSGEYVECIGGNVMIDGIRRQENYLSRAALMDKRGCDPVKVPSDNIFVLGDNRIASTDSRSFGPVANENIDGVVIGVIHRDDAHIRFAFVE